MSRYDSEIFDLIGKEEKRQIENLEMIASENYTFKEVLEASGSILTNKYAEGYPQKRYYGGCEIIDEIESLAINRVKKLFGCKYANVQPHSGSQANNAVYFALLNSGDKVLGMGLPYGGHLTHGATVNFSGKMYHSFSYGINGDGYIDYDEVLNIAKIVRPKMIIAGASAYSRDINFKKFREIADTVGAYLMADVAHVAGLIIANEHSNPFPYADVVTTTTHKTLRGTRGGVILCNDEEISKKINSAIFPGTQGGPLPHIIAAKAVGFKYNLAPEWKDYAIKVKKHAKILANVLSNRGYEIVSGGTDNHLILVSFLNKDFTGKDASLALENAGITVNKNTVPNETRSPFITSGVRIGSPALTSRGMGEEEFNLIANKIADIFDNISDASMQLEIKKELVNIARNFTIYQ